MVSIEGLNAGTETEPIIVRRRWWRDPAERTDPTTVSRRSPWELCTLQQDREMTANETDPQAADSAACWAAQAEDMGQLADEIQHGHLEVPQQMQQLYSELTDQRPDLDIYVEPTPVEVVDTADLTSPPSLISNGVLQEVSLVVDDPCSAQTSRLTMHQDPHRGNTVFGHEHTSGTVRDTAAWQNWNPAFDIEVGLKDEATITTAGQQHMDQVVSLFRVWAVNMPSQPPDAGGEIDQHLINQQSSFSGQAVPVVN